MIIYLWFNDKVEATKTEKKKLSYNKIHIETHTKERKSMHKQQLLWLSVDRCWFACGLSILYGFDFFYSCEITRGWWGGAIVILAFHAHQEAIIQLNEIRRSKTIEKKKRTTEEDHKHYVVVVSVKSVVYAAPIRPAVCKMGAHPPHWYIDTIDRYGSYEICVLLIFVVSMCAASIIRRPHATTKTDD